MQTGEGESHAPGLRPIEPGPAHPQPLVSVLMSNYNYGHYIGRSIESVLSQTYSKFELIICDDGSTDNSVAAIQPYLNDPRVRLLRKQNGGQATGFNLGWSQSRGGIICFLDADDFYLPVKLARVVESTILNPDCGCVLNGFLRVDQDLQPQGTMPLLTSLPSGWCAGRVLQEGGVLVNMPCTPGLNLRREVAEALFPLPVRQPLNRFPDMVMMRLTPLLCRLAAINEPLAVVRLHGDNTYQYKRVTAGSLQHEMDICQELWDEQRRRLEQMDAHLAETLTPLDSSPIIARQRYICSRLSHAPDRWACHRRLLAKMRRDGDRLLPQAAWCATALLPRRLFDQVINIALTQNGFKQAILRLKVFAKKVRHSLSDARKMQTERRNYGNTSTAQHRNTGI